MLLVYPPVSRSTEPPPGISRLAGTMREHGLPVRCLDLNRLAFDWMLGLSPSISETDTWSRGALGRRTGELAALRTPAGYASFDRYQRSVLDLGRVLRAVSHDPACAGHPAGHPTERPEGPVPAIEKPRYLVTLTDYQDSRFSPLESGDIASCARHWRENFFAPFFVPRISQALEESGFSTLGLSVVYLSQALTAFAIAGWLREMHPKIRIIFGGGLVTSWLSQDLPALRRATFGLVDEFVAGEGESWVSSLGLAVLSPDRGAGQSPDRGEGLCPDRGSVQSPDRGEGQGSDHCPDRGEGLCPDRGSDRGSVPRPGRDAGPSGVPSPSRVRSYGCPSFEDFPLDSYFSAGRTLPYSFSTGCPWKKCSFCPEKAENSPFRGITPALAVAHLRELTRRWKPALYHFCDNEVAPGYFKALIDSPPGAPWYGFARFSRELTDPDFCLALAASGCVMLQLGLESGEQAVLDALGKGTDMGDIDVILRNLKAAGIGTYLYVLFGTPAETLESALVTRDFLESRAGFVDFINAAVFNMPVAGEEARGLLSPRFYEGDLSLYCEFEHPAGWDRLRVRHFLRKDFGASPSIRRILARTPAAFTSNHAAFFLTGLT